MRIPPELRQSLSRQVAPHELELTPALKLTLADLSGAQALEAIALDPYWPKWDCPWWRLSLLEEMGLLKLAPEGIFRALAEAVLAVPERRFPVDPDSDIDPVQAFCHCSLGNFYRMLRSSGEPLKEFSWVLDWFASYQMADGGWNCDETAYRVKDECPSSMVATVAAVEALNGIPEADEVVKRAVGCLLERKLWLGSPTVHNREEREAASRWSQLAFPRFYHYDVLRGLEAVVAWAQLQGQALPWHSIGEVVTDLSRRFPEGRIELERRAYAGHRTRLPDGSRTEARTFELLEEVSCPGSLSPFLTARWARVREQLLALDERGLIV